MELTKKDRIYLINQYEILKRLDQDNSAGYDEYIKILSNGYAVFYNMIDMWVSDDMSAEEGKFVLDILSIYRIVEDFKRRNPEVKEIQDHNWKHFRGFDGNNESEYMGFVQFLIHTQGKFTEQLQYQSATDNYNSHMPCLDKYRRMVQKWADLGKQYQYPKETLLEILNA